MFSLIPPKIAFPDEREGMFLTIFYKNKAWNEDGAVD